MINTKVDRKGLYVRLSKINLIKKLAPLLKDKTYHCRLGDGKFVPTIPAMGVDAPWIYVKSAPARCDIYHRVMFNILKMIPSYCRECYKVVVAPRNLVELFDLYELQREMAVPSKCGMEMRKTDTRLYGGYFYCRGLEEGKERYKEVRKQVNKRLSKSTPVILKRYCSEYEIGPDGKGPSDKLPELTEEELKFEAFVLDHFPPVGYGTSQPDHVTASVMVEWIHWAYQHGDPTFKEFSNDTPLFRSAVTYHEGSKKG